MSIIGMIGIAALAGQVALLAEDGVKAKVLVVYINNLSPAPLALVGRSQGIVREMFARIGVAIHWRIGVPEPAQLANEWPIVITLTGDTPPEFQPGRLASAQPYEGVHLRVLYDRMQWAESWPNLKPMLLAHVMAHEIAHLAQGISRHSKSGLMKDRYTYNDFLSIQMNVLAFEPDDIRLIHSGLDQRASRLRLGASVVPNRGASWSH